MENIVLMDVERIRAMGISRTFSKEAEGISWENQECGYKFLVINGTLVIGPIDDHSELYAAYNMWNETIDETKVQAVAREQWRRRNHEVVGAGMIGVQGQITGWKSECFRVETPTHMRAGIEQEVSRLFQAGALTPR